MAPRRIVHFVKLELDVAEVVRREDEKETEGRAAEFLATCLAFPE